MKKINIIFELLLLYVFGCFLFNTIFSITEVIIASILSLNINLVNIFMRNLNNNIILYTLLYIFIVAIFRYISILLVKKLNRNLERRNKNEE